MDASGMPCSTPSVTPANARPKVLAVDDQLDTLRVLQLRLKVAGMDCFTCTSGRAALDFLAKQTVDAVILDVMMPGMDGFEVCRLIKADPHSRDIPVIFLTARFETNDRIAGLEAGAHDYLNKPVDQQELLARTKAAIRVKRLQDQLKEQIQLQQRINRLQQEKLSEHWIKTFGQLSSSLAHEINNPLAAALGNVQLLALEPELSQDARQRLDVVNTSLQRVARKFQSLLMIAQATPKDQTVLLSQLVEDLITLTSFAAVTRKVTVVSQVDVEGSWHGAPTELARAALYVLNNAIEAVADQEDGMVILQTDQLDGRSCLRIKDNGLGIPGEIQARIFEPFFTTKLPPHNGAGLFLAAEIVRTAGGEIRFQSPGPETATEFQISFPYGTT
jgi:DNA-binding response OmpR family regulator